MRTDQARLDALAEALRTHVWDDSFHGTAHGEHEFHAFCEICTGDVDAIADALLPLLADWTAEAWDAGYEAGSDDEVFWARGRSTDSDADEHPHDNPYRAKGEA